MSEDTGAGRQPTTWDGSDSSASEVPEVPEVPEIGADEQQQGNDRATVWYVLGSQQMSILRTVLMDQEPDTLDAWYDEALTLQKEIRRVRAWHAAGLDE